MALAWVEWEFCRACFGDHYRTHTLDDEGYGVAICADCGYTEQITNVSAWETGESGGRD